MFQLLISLDYPVHTPLILLLMDNLNIEAVEEQFYTLGDMAKLLKVSKQRIYHQIHQGKAGISIPPYVKLGGLIRFRVSDYRDWYKNLPMNGV